MKRPLGTLLIALTAYGAPAITVPRTALAGPSEVVSAEALYDDGRQAYRLGDFATAVEKWEAAYSASDNALLLYNISLAYRGRYTISGEVADLRRARAVLDNFIKVAEADPDVDVDDAHDKLAEIDQEIEEAERHARENPTEKPPESGPEGELKAPQMTPDPGKTLRLAGIGTMAGGGALVLAGAAGAAFLFYQAGRFSEDLKRDTAQFDGVPCPDPAQAELCDTLGVRIDTHRDNGKKADRSAILLLAVGGGMGTLALIAGGLVFNEGNKRTKLWEKQGFQALRIVPTPRGLSVSGRF